MSGRAVRNRTVLDKPSRRKLAAHARALLREIYQDNPAGCCLHVVTDDGNTDDGAVAVAFAAACAAHHGRCAWVAEFFRDSTRAQRRDFLRVRRR